jgi:hypothetical protein
MLIAVREQQVPLISRLAPARESFDSSSTTTIILSGGQFCSETFRKLLCKIDKN